MGQLIEHGAGNGEPAKTGVENTYWCVSHSLSLSQAKSDLPKAGNEVRHAPQVALRTGK